MSPLCHLGRYFGFRRRRVTLANVLRDDSASGNSYPPVKLGLILSLKGYVIDSTIFPEFV
jgi:hypothetical protein